MYQKSSLSRRNFVRTGSIHPGAEKGYDPVRDGYSYQQKYHDAYTHPILVHATPVQLSDAGAIPSSVPFSMPMRNASYRLDMDPNKIKYVPRNSNYPRIVGSFSEDRVAAPKSGTCGAGSEGDVLEKFSDMLMRRDRETRERDEADKKREQELKDRGMTHDPVTDTWRKTGPSVEEKAKEEAQKADETAKQNQRNSDVECYFNRNYKRDYSYRLTTVNGKRIIETWNVFTGWTPIKDNDLDFAYLNKRAGGCGS